MNKITQFHQPPSLEEAIRLKQASGHQSAYLSGGTEINSSDSIQGVTEVINLDGLLPNSITASKKGLEIGANCTFQQLINHQKTPSIIVETCHLITSRNIRNRVTVGGHIGSNHPNGVLLPVLLTLNTSVVLAEDGVHILLSDYIKSKDSSLISHIMIPNEDLHRSFSVTHFRRSANDRCLLIAATSFIQSEQQFIHPLIALGGASETAIRLFDLESNIDSKNLLDSQAIVEHVTSLIHPESSIQCSSTYKKHLAGTLVAQAIEEAGSTGGAS